MPPDALSLAAMVLTYLYFPNQDFNYTRTRVNADKKWQKIHTHFYVSSYEYSTKGLMYYTGSITLLQTNLAHLITRTPWVSGTYIISPANMRQIDCFSMQQIKYQGSHHWPLYGKVTGHDDVIKWKHFPRYWPIVNSPHTKASDAELCLEELNFTTFSQLSYWCYFLSF